MAVFLGYMLDIMLRCVGVLNDLTIDSVGFFGIMIGFVIFNIVRANVVH